MGVTEGKMASAGRRRQGRGKGGVGGGESKGRKVEEKEMNGERMCRRSKKKKR